MSVYKNFSKRVHFFSKLFWLPALAINLFPLVAAGDGEASRARGPRFNDLTAAELSSTFRNFEANIEGRNPNNRAVLYGMVFDDCKGFFDFSNSQIDGVIRGKGTVGFRISDSKGLGRECMAKHKNDACSSEMPCTRLSALPGANLDLASAGDVKIQLMHNDPDRDREQAQWEDLSSDKELAHVSGATLRAEREAEKRRQHDALVEILKKQVANCRKTDEDRDVARAAASSLEDMGVISSDAVEKLNRDLDRFELAELSRKFVKAKDQESLQEALEGLKNFEASHPESADGIAVMMYEKALSYTKNAKGSEGFDRASAMIAEAQGLSGLSETNSARLASYQQQIAVGRLQADARSGNIDPYSFWESYSGVMGNLQSDIRSCSAPAAMKTESCKATVSTYRAASQIPQEAQKTQYEQYMFYVQMQQQMSQFSGFGSPFNLASAGQPNASGFLK